MDTLYERIIALCTMNGISKNKLCKDLGWSRTNIENLRTGKTKSLSADNMAKLAEYFHISVESVMGIDPPMVGDNESLKQKRIRNMLSDASEEELDFIIRFLELRGK